MKVLHHRPEQEHEFTREQMPWFVAGTLDEVDALRVREHLAACADCRRERDTEQRLAEALRQTSSIGLAPQAALHKVMARIDAYESHRAPWRRLIQYAKDLRQPFSPAHRLTLGLQSLAIVLLAATLVLNVARRTVPEEFRTLSNATPVSSGTGLQLRVVFDERLTAGAIGELLRTVGGSIVAGPADGVFTIEVAGEAAAESRTEDKLAWLRAQPGIRFAEPVRN